MSRIHNRRLGWSLHFSRPMIDVTMMGQPFSFYPGPADYTLDLEYLDSGTAQRLMELCDSDYDRGCPQFASRSTFSPGACSVRDIRITEQEAIDIAQNGVPPIEVLLGPGKVTVRAVPVDMAQLIEELKWEVTG